MPLLDHFHPPLYPHHHWESFHSNWATRIADGIAAVLPAEFQVEEHTHAGVGFEIDVAAYQEQLSACGYWPRLVRRWQPWLRRPMLRLSPIARFRPRSPTPLRSASSAPPPG